MYQIQSFWHNPHEFLTGGVGERTLPIHPESVATIILTKFPKFSWENHMSAAEWTDTYSIHHRRSPWSSYREFAWVRFKPTTTEVRSDALTDWTIRPRVKLMLKANFVQLCAAKFFLCSLSTLILVNAFVSRHVYFNRFLL